MTNRQNYIKVFVVNVGETKVEFTDREKAFDYLEEKFKTGKYSNLYLITLLKREQPPITYYHKVIGNTLQELVI